MSKSRTKKRANSRLSTNYRPLSDSFCKSVVKGSSDNSKNDLENKIINDPNNMNTIVYNKNKTAHMRRVYDSSKLLGISVESKIGSFLIETDKNLFDIIVELLHFGFTYKQIKQFVKISQSKFNTIKSKDFKTMDDFIFILSCVPDKFFRCNDIMHYVKQIPDMIVRFPVISDLAKEMELEGDIEKCKRCMGIYTNTYPNLIEIAQKKLEAEKKTTEKEISIATEKSDVDEKTLSESGSMQENISLEVEKENVSEVNEIVEDIVEEPVIQDSTEEETEETVDTVGIVEDEVSTLEPVKKKAVKKVIDIFEYQNILGFAGLPFDFDKLGADLLEGLKKYEFSTYIEQEQKDGISNLLYVLMILNNYYVYKTPFYPAEDKILELYYKDIGVKVVDVLKAVIPEYVVRPDSEYISRVREKKYKTPHPSMAFNTWGNDVSIIKALYPKVKKAPTKYFFWLDSFDLLYLVEQEGLGSNTSKKIKEIVDLDSLDLQTYILSAEKMKEVQYHNPIWTSDRHDIFKNEYKNIGLGVLDMIDGVTKEDCIERSSQFKIYQNYTTKEIASMKEIYLDGGLEALYEAFPYRTADGLKFKVEEEGWEKLIKRGYSEEEVQKRVEVLLKERKEEYQKEVYDKFKAEEVERLSCEIRDELNPIIHEEIVKSISKMLLGPVFQELKVSLPDIVRKMTLKDLPSVLPQKISTQLESILKDEISKI